ncbi:cyclin-dependent kinase inhibitor 1D [Clarias gariepinus]|uniref:cyclin-dependent kinase inhibitor 1D n=1 Tax=Clarias gariepinus TaxID=13013 RepID=UPI00234CBA8F|nr:cyclin-dependent kinase inhibitor 1D [Clarias gariepinus]
MRKMAMTSSQFDHLKLNRVEEGDKPRGKAVRRNLFGPVDHQQLQQDFNRLLCMGAEVAKQRWNFDFESDHPTPGSVKWEEMQCQDVPAFYRSCVVRTGKRRPEVPISAGGKRAVKYRQATITDFYMVKKKRFLHYKVPLRQ